MKKYILSAAITMLAFAGLSSCSKDKNDETVSDANTIRITSAGYSNPRLEIFSGNSVKWVNDDNIVHTVTADDNGFSSGDIQPGASFQLRFTSLGSYAYHCNYQSGMNATIVVVGTR